MTALTSYDGIALLGTYLHDGTDIDVLLALIPDVDHADDGSGPQAGGGYLDEMSPACAVQLRAELGAIGSAGAAYRVGTYTVTAGDDTANQVDIVSGLDDLTPLSCVIQIKRGVLNVTADAAISEPVPGTVRIANGATYVLTTGDVITYYLE